MSSHKFNSFYGDPPEELPDFSEDPTSSGNWIIHSFTSVNHLMSPSFLSLLLWINFFRQSSQLLQEILRKSFSNQIPSTWLVALIFNTKVALPCGSETSISLFSFYLRNTSSPFPLQTQHCTSSNPTLWSVFLDLTDSLLPQQKLLMYDFPHVNHSRSDFETTLPLVEFFSVKLSCELSLETVYKFFSFYKVYSTCIQAFKGERHGRVNHFDEMYVVAPEKIH